MIKNGNIQQSTRKTTAQPGKLKQSKRQVGFLRDFLQMAVKEHQSMVCDTTNQENQLCQHRDVMVLVSMH